ncbi:hypothetical protein [Brevundimonas vesicularis]|uniref:hypothetical protein n=1 Tax=Brevundimonas vesicularis TaxID=41276 RepID=UPI00142F35F9|nr:hypothetical protein [Brevundimonas vesicularis]
MTGRDLNAWLATGDGKEPVARPTPPAVAPTAHLSDQTFADAFLCYVRARNRGNRPCA